MNEHAVRAASGSRQQIAPSTLWQVRPFDLATPDIKLVRARKP